MKDAASAVWVLVTNTASVRCKLIAYTKAECRRSISVSTDTVDRQKSTEKKSADF